MAVESVSQDVGTWGQVEYSGNWNHFYVSGNWDAQQQELRLHQEAKSLLYRVWGEI